MGSLGQAERVSCQWWVTGSWQAGRDLAPLAGCLAAQEGYSLATQTPQLSYQGPLPRTQQSPLSVWKWRCGRGLLTGRLSLPIYGPHGVEHWQDGPGVDGGGEVGRGSPSYRSFLGRLG